MSTVLDPEMTPGAMEHYKSRELPGGALLEFEQAPAGWLTKDGEPRRADWRAYHYTPALHPCPECQGAGRIAGKTAKGRKCPTCDGTGEGSKRKRMPSVTTLLDAIIPKPGIVPWAEARGIEGAITAVRSGAIDVDVVENPVEAVRALRLGADAAKDEAATRGLNVHSLLETYMLDGTPPGVEGHPEGHHGYIRALSSWLVDADPEPTAVEQLVCSQRYGFAGRLDLRARIARLDTLVDLKTQENAGIYEGAHVQCGMYTIALEENGDRPPERSIVVVLAANGEYRVMDCMASEATIKAALTWHQHVGPIQRACASANQRERNARRAA